MNIDNNNKFFVDGEYVDSETLKDLFSGSSLDKRQFVCLNLIEGKSVLDVGCYSGYFVNYAIKHYPEKEFYGIDYYDENIKIAHFLYPGMRENILKMSTYNMDFEDERFDCITCQEVMEHLENAAIAIKEMNRILKINGSLILSVPNPYHWKTVFGFLVIEIKNIFNRIFFKKSPELYPEIFFDSVEWGRHIYSWTGATLLTLLMVNGFSYVTHSFADESKSKIEQLFLKLFPFFGGVQIIKARKTSRANSNAV